MDYVQHIEHASVWLRKAGIYRPTKLFSRGETLFAESGSGYVRLHAAGATSAPNMVWLGIDPGPDHRLAHTDRQPPKIEPIKKAVKKAD